MALAGRAGLGQSPRMLRATVVAFVLLLVATPLAADPTTRDPARIPAGTYELDNRHAALLVKIPHLGGFARYVMRFNKLSGSFTFDPAAWSATRVVITVDPKSIDSEDNLFNRVIAGYFEPEKYPVIRFTSSRLTMTGEGVGKLEGDLLFHGVTKPVTLDVTFNGVGPGLMGLGTRVGFSGTGQIKRSEFGVTQARPFAGDTVDLVFEIEFAKK